jgi:hypothetical protein
MESPRHYGRLDGLPILLRVVHVVQVKLTNRCLVAHQGTKDWLKVKAKDFKKIREFKGIHTNDAKKTNKSATDRQLPASATALQGVRSRE